MVSTLLLALVGTVGAAAPAWADSSAVLDVTKTVDHSAVQRGDSFLYTIAVSCSTDDCDSATLVDTVPAQFAALTLGPTVIITGGPATYTWGGSDGRTLTVTFNQALPGGTKGITAGTGYTIQYGMTVPSGLSADWSSNGVAVTNTATASALNADDKSDSADVTVTVPIAVSTAATKKWAPASALYKAGDASAITLSTANTSNVAAESLRLAEPADPTDAGNPFEDVDLDSLGAVTFPAGADRVTVDAFTGTAWVTGDPATTAALPAGVAVSTVSGLRVTFTSTTGTTISAGGSAGKIVLNVVQRANTRTGSSALILGATASNTAESTVRVPGQAAATATATATYSIVALTTSVSATKSFAPSSIPAGGTSVATVTAKNTSNTTLDTLTVTEPGTAGDFFSPTVTFDGFTSASTWPSGASSATVSWQVDSGSAPAASTVTGTPLPATPTLAPGQRITGFVVAYSGSIAVNASAAVAFTTAVDADAVTTDTPVVLQNTAQADATNAAGAATPATASASLTVLKPSVKVSLDKTVSPGAAVPAGGRNTVQLLATVVSGAEMVPPKSITIDDKPGAIAPDYWDGFDAAAIAPTSVPLGSTLTVGYSLTGDAPFTTLATVDATSSAQVYSGALPAGVTAVRFVFANSGGFALGSQVKPAISFVARSIVRGTASDQTSSVGTDVVYTNGASATVRSEILRSGATVDLTDTAADTATGTIKALGGNGGIGLGKNWQVPSGAGSPDVMSQSGQSRTARVLWKSEVNGYGSVTVSDTKDTSTPIADTVFQAFNLTGIPAITTALDPYIGYDAISKVELYNGTTWVAVGTCTPLAPCKGSFPGYTLTAAQQLSTVGVRLTFVENPNRATTTDQQSPQPGTGVASGPNNRGIDLVFQLRNSRRDQTAAPAAQWVTAGSVVNTAAISAQPQDLTAAPITAEASDSIQVIDPVPAVASTKASQFASMAIPNPGDVPVANYPTNKFTLTTTNGSVARAWFMRVTDPLLCPATDVSSCAHNSAGAVHGYDADPFTGAVYDPATNPFERYTITAVTINRSTNSGIDAHKTAVTLWHFDGTTTTVAGDDASLGSPTALADVVGVSVLYASTDTSDGGTIAANAVGTTVLTTQLRLKMRSDSTVVVTPASVKNASFSELYDNVLPDTNVFDSKSATIALNTGSIAVTATKSFSPTTLIEASRTADVTMTLGADQGASTASTREVVVEDSTAGFWNRFDLRSLGTVTKPAGADLVAVGVQLDGASAWTTGTASSTAAFPTLPSGKTIANVTGIRFTFTKADGSLFSNTAPGGKWTTSIVTTVRLRSAFRDSGAPIIFAATSIAVPNTVTTSSTHDVFGTATASATASMTLSPGTFSVDVVKTPSVTTSPAGESVDFSLVVTNTGTGFLDNPVITDQLPTDGALAAGGPLLYDPTTDATYSTSTGGILPTTGVSVAYDAATRRVAFTWPTGSRLAPGEKYTIVLPLQVAPGLPGSYPAIVNTFGVTSDRTLAACTNTSGNGQGVVFSTDHLSCSTKNSITTYSASAISSFKGVKGNVDATGNSTSGATNTKDASTACVADSQGYYRSPCAANTVVGGTDQWKLRFTNGGNIAATSATVVDVLPRSGDTFLRTSASRGSAFAPVFAGGLTLATDSLSAGTTYTWQVTTAANPCPAFDTNPTCSTVTWSDGATFPTGNYKAITAIRAVFDFTNVAGGSHTLAPMASIALTYQTVNSPSTSAGDGRAPVTAPVTNARAWNTFGVYAVFSDSSTRRVEPLKAGVQLATGPLSVTKVVDGASAAYAPTSFTVTVTCTVAGANMTLPNGGKLVLSAGSTEPYTGRIDGIPVGAECTVLETSASGASSVAYSPAAPGGGAVVTIATAGASTAPVPAAQRATVTNTYGTQNLTITKTVVSPTTVGSFGPYDFTLTCSVNNGTSVLPVPFGTGTTASFTLADTESKKFTDLPINATCQLREVDSDGASSIRASVDAATAKATTQGAAIPVTITPGADHTVAVTNTFDGGTLSVTKTVAGGGSAGYGSGPFTIAVKCEYGSQTLFDDSFSITGGVTKTLAPVFPVGTSCAVTETDAGGATSTSGEATVLIPAPAGAAALGAVTVNVTNTFGTGSLRIVKSITGDGADAYGSGPFEATATCSWTVDGTEYAIPLPDGGRVALTAANSYEATVSGLIAGASCSVVESKTGAATTSTVGAISPSVIPDGGESVVHIVNDFATGSLVINKVRTGDGVTRFGDGPFTMAVACSYLKDGAQVAIDLGSNAVQVLDADGHYTARIDGLLAGASCTVTETDRGLAVASSTDPVDGIVTIVDSATVGGVEPTPATVTVTNDFEIGHLVITKTASTPIVQGGLAYDYDLAVRNSGVVSAAGVLVTDPIDADLAVTSVDAAGWKDCGVTDADADGFGGKLSCELKTDLGAGATAPVITLSVTVRDTVAKDEIDNIATVSSSDPIIDGDTDESDVTVRWLAVAASSVCTKDAPWLGYTVIPHNVPTAGKTMSVNWAQTDGALVHQDNVAVQQDSTVDGQLLWPGAAVDKNGDGIAWPGYRVAKPGEKADWQGLKLDPKAYGYGLRTDPKVSFSILAPAVHSAKGVTTAATTAAASSGAPMVAPAALIVAYPKATSDCERSAMVTRAADLSITKKASVDHIDPGASFSYAMVVSNSGIGAAESVVLTDPVPSTLRVTGVKMAKAAKDGPGWTSCVIRHRTASGMGGTLSCVLNRALLMGESTPAVTLSVTVDGQVPAGLISNTATATATDPTGPVQALSVHDTARVTTGGFLALTGYYLAPTGFTALALLFLGIAFLAFAWAATRRRRHDGSPENT